MSRFTVDVFFWEIRHSKSDPGTITRHFGDACYVCWFRRNRTIGANCGEKLRSPKKLVIKTFFRSNEEEHLWSIIVFLFNNRVTTFRPSHSHDSDVVVMPGKVGHSFTQGRTRIEEIKEQIFLETKWALSHHLRFSWNYTMQ